MFSGVLAYLFVRVALRFSLISHVFLRLEAARYVILLFSEVLTY